MSYIGEARAYGKAVKELEQKLKDENLTDEEKDKIKEDIEMYEDEVRHSWNEARHETKMEASWDEQG